jgi:hypothetical protein
MYGYARSLWVGGNCGSCWRGCVIQASGWWEGALQNGYVWMGRMGQQQAGKMVWGWRGGGYWGGGGRRCCVWWAGYGDGLIDVYE